MKTPKDAPDFTTLQTVNRGPNGLGSYIADPDSFPPSRIVYSNDKFVVINDLYPKSTIHLLILPRNPEKYLLVPQVAFDDVTFLADCVQEEKKVRAIVANELRRKFGRQSDSDRPRVDALERDDPPEELPPGRDWDKEIISGIHANPSMNHLHIHVMSRDMVSECMKRYNHYQSFTTDFLVPLDQFPLAQSDHRRHYSWSQQDLICWRCGKNFSNRFTKLKDHLEREKQDWVKE